MAEIVYLLFALFGLIQSMWEIPKIFLYFQTRRSEGICK